MLRDLDMRDTAVLKGIAISAIVFHNFFHAVSPVHENEFTFDAARFSAFLGTMSHPQLAVQALLAFFGHFGVQIFIFLSAYGLAKSRWDDPAGWAGFMAGRIKKLYPVFGLVVLPWVLALSVEIGPLTVLKKIGLQLGLMFLGLSPFLPNVGLPPIGPWWFIAFIVEFYALWPFLRSLTRRFGWLGLLALSAVCLVMTAVLNPLLARWSINLLETPFGRMPVACFGILAARYPIRIQVPLAFGAAAVLILGSMYQQIWLLTFLAALIVSLALYMPFRNKLRRSVVLERLGRYSLLIFLINGIIRNEFAPMAGGPGSQILLACVTAVLSFAIAAAMQELLLSPMQRTRQPLPG